MKRALLCCLLLLLGAGPLAAQQIRVRSGEHENFVAAGEPVFVVEGLEIIQIGVGQGEVRFFVNGALNKLYNGIIARKAGKGVGVERTGSPAKHELKPCFHCVC